ncbi:MAG: RNA ligase [Paracoccaceae bacterium]
MEIVIEHLDDVLPHIQPDTGIIHSVHNGYSVINYVFSVEETFDTAIARECRGLKFAPDGTLIARPFHKFFNLGENRPPQDEPWDTGHIILDKLDGSMIHPAMVEGDLVFMTRMGRSDQAEQAWSKASAGVKALSTQMIDAGYTPIFEFTSPENRIVVAYEAPELTLLAIRHMRTGSYMPHNEVAQKGVEHGVVVTESFGAVKDVAKFWTDARKLEGVEGYVIAFENGHRVKIKADAYVLRHKALAGLAYEKNLLAWIATDAVDDVLPLLAPEAADFVREYQTQVMDAVSQWETKIEEFVAENADLPRKDFAMKTKDVVPARLQSVAFRALDGTPARICLMEVLERASGSDTKVEGIRSLIGMTWRPIATEE